MDKKGKEIIGEVHKKAFAKAKNKLPKADVIAVLKSAADAAAKGDPKEFAKIIGKEYQGFAFEYAKVFAQEAIDRTLKDSERAELQALAKKKLGKSLVGFSLKAAASVQKYMKHDITAEQLADELYRDGLAEVAKKIIEAFALDQLDLNEVSVRVQQELGIDLNMLLKNPEVLMNMSLPIITYNACMGAYKELSKALKDLELAREERLAIEAACSESVEMIVAARKEMEERVSDYLSGHIDMFEEGFTMMDQAILENDTEGFIRGNVTIQKALGYDVQFTNQDEFDALMDSDDAFKL